MADASDELESANWLVSEYYEKLSALEPTHELLQWYKLFWSLDGRFPLWNYTKKLKLVPRFWCSRLGDWCEYSNAELWTAWLMEYYLELEKVLKSRGSLTP